MTRDISRAIVLSVIVPTHNRRDSVVRLLGALRQQVDAAGAVSGDRIEVVVVADGCEDGTVDTLHRSVESDDWPFALAVLECLPARGASHGRNAGAARASGQLLLFVDDDIEPFTTMIATHMAMHAEATSRGEWLLVVGAPVPVRSAHASIHEISAWGWWEQQFERMGAPGHRFTYDEIFTGVLSMPAARFREVGGFDTTLGDCHEDSELGLRLFRAGARCAFTRSGGGLHHEIRDMKRLLPRKWAEGRADVRIARRWPELAGYLTLAGRASYPLTALNLLRWRAFTMPVSAALTTRVALPLLARVGRWGLRGTWRTLHGGLLAQSYWHGVAAEVGSEAALQRLVAAGHDGWHRWSALSRHLTVDLSHGIDTVERLLDAERPDALTIQLGNVPVGTVVPLPVAERLHGGHLRRLLATELARALAVARALRSAQTPLPAASPQRRADGRTWKRALHATARAGGSDAPAHPVEISVVIPAWNAAPTIGRALESLLAQTMVRWEAIVVDDGSTDDTATIVREYGVRDPRIRLVQQANGGVSAARNAGIGQASHDWLHFLDADDWMAPMAFARLARAVADDPSLDAVHCGWARVTTDGQTIAEERCWQVGDLFSAFATRCAFAVHACLVWRAAVEAVGGFDPSIRISQDWVLWQRLARLGANFGGIPDTLALYAHRADSLSNDPLPLFHESLSIMALGHDFDLRVPDGPHANGRPAHELAEAQLGYACWVAGMLIGRGEDAVPLLAFVPRPGIVPPPISIADNLYRAVPHSLGVPPREWPVCWQRLERDLTPFLDALERHVGVSAYARAVRVALERRVAPHVESADMVLGMHDVRACEVTAPITDVVGAEGAERLAVTVLVRGTPIGMVELPVIDGRVLAVVVRDAIADAFAWPILGRFFEGSLYRSIDFREDGDGWSAWRSGVQLATTLPNDHRARLDTLHDIVGWDHFMRAVWGERDDSETAERIAPSIDGWSAVEVSDPPTAIRLCEGSRRVAFHVGGVAIAAVIVDGEGDAVAAHALRTRLSDAVGFELCRAAVREGVLGAPWSDGDTLSSRLSRAAALGSDMSALDGTLHTSGATAAPDLRRQVQRLDPSQQTSFFLARRADRFEGGSGSRTYAIPSEHAQTLASLELAVGTPYFEMDGPDPTRALSAPSLLWWRSHTAPSRAIPDTATVVPGATHRDPGDDAGARAVLTTVPPPDQRIPILMYHRVAPDGAAERRRWRVSPDAFDAQMRTLCRLGYHATTLAEWQHAVAAKRSLPGRPLILTFDDGYTDLAEYAWPILRRHGLRALAFVVTGSVGRWNEWDAGGESEPLLDWPALRQMRDDGMEFGAHSVSHRRMTSLSPADSFAEALHSRRRLREELGIAADTFAYPFGNEDPIQQSLIGAAGYQFGLSVRSGSAARNAPWLSLPRIEICGDDDLASFQTKLES